jgi:two-component system, cell cycle sensor histidine kinase and response regulator CckA
MSIPTPPSVDGNGGAGDGNTATGAPRADWHESHLRRLEELGRLAGAVAHDFNNLLTVIRSYAQLMLDQAAAGQPMSPDDAREIEHAAARGSELTRRLLAFARKQVIEPRLVDAGHAISALDGMLRPLVGSRVTVEYRLEHGLPPVLIDPVQLDQVVLNLVVNAVHAMPDGGHLVIRVGREQSAIDHAIARFGEGTPPPDPIVLEVTDTGHGMDRATLARAFEPFFTTKSTEIGTGLGLSVVSGIVRRVGGALQVASAPGVGTTFRVLWPVAPPRARRTGDEDSVRGSGLTCVMIVEDDDGVRQLTRRVLIEAGFDVALAADGRAARERFAAEWPEEGGPSVVLADIATPHEDGWALANWLLTARPGLPVVLMSALDWGRMPMSMPPNVPVPILQKPFSAADLISALRAALEWGELAAGQR